MKKNKKGAWFTVKGKIKVQTHISKADVSFNTVNGLLGEAILAAVQEYGTQKAKELVEEIFSNHDENFKGYVSLYDENGRLKKE